MSKFKHKFMLKLRNKKQGFSLIELLVTIAIIGILSAVAIPAYQNYTDKAKAGVAESILQTALRNIQINKELGDDSTSANIAASIKSKGSFILITGEGALKITSPAAATPILVGGDNNVTKNADTYCVSVTEKTTSDPKYPAACIEENGVVYFNSSKDACLNTGKCGT